MSPAPPSPGASAEPPGLLAGPGAVAVVVLALTLVRLAFSAVVPITEDEAYYRLWALHLAPGYLDHPPMVAVWIAGGMAIAGDNAVGVRLLFVLAPLLGSLALWRTARLLFGDAAVAGRAALWLNATLMVGVGALIATPDGPSTLFWGLALWAVAEARASGRGAWWLAVGAFAGLGLASKYSALFLGAGLVVWILVEPRRRRLLLDPWLWAGGVLALALFAPVVSWNAAHDWASFAKQFGRAAPDGLTLAYLPEFLGAEIGLLGPLMLPFLVLGIVAALRRRGGDDGGRLLVWTSLPFLAYLLVHTLHARVQANWPAPLFPAFALLAAVAAGGVSAGWLVRLRAWVAPVGIALSLLALVVAAVPIPGLARLDPMARYRGWPAAAAEIEAARRAAGAAWIATAAYGPTAMLAWHLPGVPVVQLDERLRYANAPPPAAALLAEPALLVIDARARKADALAARFGAVADAGTVERRAAGEPVARYRLWRAAQPAGDPLGDDDR